MSTRIKLAFAAVLALAASAALADQAAAAARHGGWYATHGTFIDRSVALPYGPARSGRYSGPFRTDSAPLTGGGY
jgi:hypothetical protein